MLDGKTFDEIKFLLGDNDGYAFPNSKRDTFPDSDNYKRVTYRLGGQRDGGIDYEWLDIIFKDDRVIQCIEWHD